MKIENNEDYDAEFIRKDIDGSKKNKDAKKALRLEKILETRNFEIELYWKRATYFWTFIAATLAGYGLTVTTKVENQDQILKFQFVIICLGLVFSIAWYLVNKGSKY